MKQHQGSRIFSNIFAIGGMIMLSTLTACQSTDTANTGNDADSPAVNVGTIATTNTYSTAIGILEQAAVSEYPQMRANAIEALHNAPELVLPYAQDGLADDNRGVRFVSAMTIGKFKEKSALHLLEPLLNDPSQSVQAAALYAMHECGRKVDLSPLGRMIRSNDPEVRGNAAMVFGLLGNESAVPLLEASVQQGMNLAEPAREKVVELQIAESLFYLGQEDQVQTIRAALYYPPDQQEMTALACIMLGRMQDQGAIGGLQRLISAEGDERRPAEVRMAATLALSQLGVRTSTDWIAEYLNHNSPALRLQAALTLGEIGDQRAYAALENLLNDREPLVRLAAADSVVQLQRN